MFFLLLLFTVVVVAVVVVVVVFVIHCGCGRSRFGRDLRPVATVTEGKRKIPEIKMNIGYFLKNVQKEGKQSGPAHCRVCALRNLNHGLRSKTTNWGQNARNSLQSIMIG